MKSHGKGQYDDTLPRTKKRLVVKPETIRTLHLGRPALRNVHDLSKDECPHPPPDILPE